MLELKRTSVVYVLCPAGTTTGGPEALHQLAHQLIGFGVDARIVYFTGNPNHEDWANNSQQWVKSVTPLYAHYGVRVANEIIDAPENVVIAPELWPFALGRLRHCQKAIWWLAAIPEMQSILENFPGDVRALTHLCQSAFARHSLHALGAAKTFMLSDYTRPSYLLPFDPAAKEPVVAYSPAKGMEYTSAILQHLPDVKFERLQGMTPEQLHETLRRSMLFIDFGHHPGKDRIPREAAISGCCVIVARRGSANFYHDVPIPERFKFSTDQFDIVDIVSGILHVLGNYHSESQSFDFYRTAIMNEEANFEDEVREAFVDGIAG